MLHRRLREAIRRANNVNSDPNKHGVTPPLPAHRTSIRFHQVRGNQLHVSLPVKPSSNNQTQCVELSSNSGHVCLVPSAARQQVLASRKGEYPSQSPLNTPKSLSIIINHLACKQPRVSFHSTAYASLPSFSPSSYLPHHVPPRAFVPAPLLSAYSPHGQVTPEVIST